MQRANCTFAHIASRGSYCSAAVLAVAPVSLGECRFECINVSGRDLVARGTHNAGYVNRFGRGLQAPARFRFSSTVDPPGRITRFVGKQYPVASDFEAISSPLERQFSSSSLHRPEERSWVYP